MSTMTFQDLTRQVKEYIARQSTNPKVQVRPPSRDKDNEEVVGMEAKNGGGRGGTNNTPSENQVSLPQPADWTLTWKLCNLLCIPETIFVSKAVMESTATNLLKAQQFTEQASKILDLLDQLLTIQQIDNTLILHRLILSCAGVSNPKDLWSSEIVASKAIQVLKRIEQDTPWEETTTQLSTSNKLLTVIMVPGNLSSHLLQIMDKEIRPCFASRQADRVVSRAAPVLEAQKSRLQRLTDSETASLLVSEYENSTFKADEDDESSVTIFKREERIIPSLPSQDRPQHQSSQTSNTQRLYLPKIGDESHELTEEYTYTDKDQIANKWDIDRLEVVAVTEWCSKAFRDTSRTQEFFLLLLGPILALTDSSHNRDRIRGLNLMSQFLLNQGSIFSQSISSTSTRTGERSRIWIQIFDRTGLDQVLIRSVVPCLTPLGSRVMADAKGGSTNSMDMMLPKEKIEELAMMHAAFRSYLILIQARTEPEGVGHQQQPQTRQGYTLAQPKVSKPTQLVGVDKFNFTLEDLLVHGVLASTQRSNPSRKMQILVVYWLRILMADQIQVPPESIESVMTCMVSTLDPSSRLAVAKNLPSQIGLPNQGLNEFQEQQSTPHWMSGLGRQTIKYLNMIVRFLTPMLHAEIPSRSALLYAWERFGDQSTTLADAKDMPTDRHEALELAFWISEGLQVLVLETFPRIPRYRGVILAAIAACWANSRVSLSVDGKNIEEKDKCLVQLQEKLDKSLVKLMAMYTKVCADDLDIRKVAQKSGGKSGLDLDIEILKDLDPPVFTPLFIECK